MGFWGKFIKKKSEETPVETATVIAETPEERTAEAVAENQPETTVVEEMIVAETATITEEQPEEMAVEAIATQPEEAGQEAVEEVAPEEITPEAAAVSEATAVEEAAPEEVTPEAAAVNEATAVEEVAPQEEKPKEKKNSFWGKLFKKNPQEETTAPVAENPVEGVTVIAETPEETAAEAVAENQPETMVVEEMIIAETATVVTEEQPAEMAVEAIATQPEEAGQEAVEEAAPEEITPEAAATVSETTAVEEATPQEEKPEEKKTSFWGKLFKKNPQEAATAPVAENPVEGATVIAETPEETAAEAVAENQPETTVVEEMVVAETAAVAEEQPKTTAVEEIVGEAVAPEETVEEAAPQEEKPEEKKEGFWGKLFKKNPQEETTASVAENPVENTTVIAETPEENAAEAVAEKQSEATSTAAPQEVAPETNVIPNDNAVGMLGRLKRGLAQTRLNISGKIEGLIKHSIKLDDDFYDELEDILMQADVGVETTMKLVENIRRSVHKKKIREVNQVFAIIKEEIRAILGEEKVDMEAVETRPAVILVVGVNGAGKTTSIAKMAWRFKNSGSKVLLAAADTFRAAAIDQLQIWADRVGVGIVKHEEGSDPGAVVFDAVQEAKKGNYDILIVDTAGRLQNKANLMKEISKLRKIISREIEGAPHEVLLVLDATTGQNALNQAAQFAEVTGVTGIILTKLDGTAKGGVVIAISSELNIPVKLIGIGEGMEDLREFSAAAFAEALFAPGEEAHNQTGEESAHEDTH